MVGFAERAIQALLETARLLPHREPLLVEGARDLLVLREAHLELHRRRRRHLRALGASDGGGLLDRGLGIAMEGLPDGGTARGSTVRAI